MDIDAFTNVASRKHTATTRVKAIHATRTVATEVDCHPTGTVIAEVIPAAFGIATITHAFDHRTAVAVIDTVVTVARAAIRLFEAAFQAFTRRRRWRRRRRIMPFSLLIVFNMNSKTSPCPRTEQKRCSQDCKKGSFHSFSLLLNKRFRKSLWCKYNLFSKHHTTSGKKI